MLHVQTVKSSNCTRCGRPLRDPVSVQRGMGPVCAGRAKADVAERQQETGVIVTVDGRPLEHVVRHSPTGLEWGYGGSGPSDLALSILTDYLGDQTLADKVYQRFKSDVVSQWPYEGWRMTGAEIAEWLRDQGIEAPARQVVYEGRRAA